MHNFKLQFWHVGGCGGYPLSSKSILKVVSQMVRFCDCGTALFFYLHIGFLTFLALLKNTFWDGTPCTKVGTPILCNTYILQGVPSQNVFFKGLKMSENQYVDKKIRQ